MENLGKVDQEGKAEPRPGTDGGPLAGCRWRYSEGQLFCGSMRVMRDDWDTQPAPEVRRENMDWVCRILNAAGGATPGGLRSIEQGLEESVTLIGADGIEGACIVWRNDQCREFCEIAVGRGRIYGRSEPNLPWSILAIIPAGRGLL